MKALLAIIGLVVGGFAIGWEQDSFKDILFFISKNYNEIFTQIQVTLGSILAFSLVLVKLTPTPKDDEIVEGFYASWLKFTQWLPSIGISPRTKQLETTLKKAQAGYKVRPK